MSKRIELIKKFVFSNNAVAAQPMGAGYSGKLGPIRRRVFMSRDLYGPIRRRAEVMSHEDCYTFVMHRLACTDACTDRIKH